LENDDLFKRYLLGDLSQEEEEELEKRCNSDAAYSEALEAAENDLIDAYLCQELSDRERRQFDTHFQDSERHLRVEVARMLMSPEARRKLSLGPIVQERPVPWWSASFLIRAGLAGAAIVGIIAIAFLLVQNVHLRQELNSSRSTQTALKNQVDSLQRQNATAHVGFQGRVPPPQSPAASIVSVVLSPGLLRTRASQSNRQLVLSPATTAVVLVLALEPSNATPTNYSRYDVVLESVEGTTIQRLKGLTSSPAPDGGKLVAARFAAPMLKDGDYIVTLVGRADGDEGRELASYSFSILR
jgi:hypothetical protein